MNMVPYLSAYYATLLAFFAFSFYPVGRLWGFSHWAYLSLEFRLVLLAVGLIMPILIHFFAKQKGTDAARPNRKYLFLAAGVGLALVASFYFLRAETFFHGDGYILIGMIGAKNVLAVKLRNIGTSGLHVWLFDMFGGSTEQDAVKVFQAVSIGAGVMLVGLTAILCRRLFPDRKTGALCFLGIISGGFMLMYFGYVEYYALFDLVVVTYVLTGLLILRRLAPKWSILPLQGLAVVFHIFGFLFVPATAYLLLRETSFYRRLWALTTRVKILIIIACSIVAGWLFVYKWNTDFFFQYAFVPPFQTRLTLENYTLFSIAHLGDFMGVIFTVFPGILLGLVLWRSRMFWRNRIKRVEHRWLLLLCGLTLCAAFVFDPKLGMPRDWDLFAFSMIPIIVWFYYALLSSRRLRKISAQVALLCICLGFLTLIPRAQSMIDPEAAIPRFRYYLDLDKVKNRYAWLFLHNYYQNQGDSARSAETLQEWNSRFPERLLLQRANKMYYVDGQVELAVGLLYRLIEMNPQHSQAYDFLGVHYLDSHQYDTALALLQIADGLQPYRASTVSNLGRAYHMTGVLDRAEECFEQSLRLDTTNFALYYNMASLHRDLSNIEEYMRYLERSAVCEGVVPWIEKELINRYLAQGEMNKAVAAFRRSGQLAADTAFVSQIRQRYPQWDSLMRAP